jgi:hypothetical protein
MTFLALDSILKNDKERWSKALAPDVVPKSLEWEMVGDRKKFALSQT